MIHDVSAITNPHILLDIRDCAADVLLCPMERNNHRAYFATDIVIFPVSNAYPDLAIAQLPFTKSQK